MLSNGPYIHERSRIGLETPIRHNHNTNENYAACGNC